MNRKKYNKTILTMMLGVLFSYIFAGCSNNVNPGKFVAVPDNSSDMVYSEDGLNWKTGQIGVPYDIWGDVYYGNGLFVAVGGEITGGKAAYSTNGNNWHVDTQLITGAWKVCYGNGKFIALGTFGSSALWAFSPNGKEWSSGQFSEAEFAGRIFKSICYGNGKFVAVGTSSGGDNYAITASSTDGKNWTLVISPNKATWHSVCYGKGRFVAVGTTGDNSSAITAYSTDGKIWSTEEILTYGDMNNLKSVSYGNGKFVAICGRPVNGGPPYNGFYCTFKGWNKLEF